MEKDILNIFDSKKYDEKQKRKDDKFASLLNNLDDIDEKRLRNKKYNNEVAKILIDTNLSN